MYLFLLYISCKYVIILHSSSVNAFIFVNAHILWILWENLKVYCLPHFYFFLPKIIVVSILTFIK